MTKQYFYRAVALNESENNEVTELKSKGTKVIDIFRRGLTAISGKDFNKKKVNKTIDNPVLEE